MTERLLEGVPRLARQLRRDRRTLAITLEAVWGDAFDLYDAIAYASYEQGARWAAEATVDDATRPIVWSTLLDLHARACCVAAEVGVLQRTGFPSGAEARHRTLHELAVIAAVLQDSDEEITRRYRDFEAVEHYQDAKAYQEHAEALGRTPLPDGEMAILLAWHDEVVDRWGGKSFARPLGWAAPICSKSNPGIADLEGLAGVAHLRPFYRYGNHAVHGGPRAAALQRIDIEGKPHRTPGATVYADFAETGHGAIILLQQVNAALLSELTRSDGIDTDSVVALGSLNQLVNQCGDAFGAAADVARSRGWFLHGRDD
ncbi:DUF5677 domain-containing protein [Ilumatobacter coccineus]|uniref:DUF5677 domain-containing protein n=1 Tax=Ilumatobacter coccineus TaxID=467094 RepID=UPI000347E33D|nr:DUF5677 domain-containing protein [Ilumatobacter coccineus]